LVAEIVVLVIVGALPPQVPNEVVTAAIAFTSALQVSTFRSLQGIDYSTTLTTSNLRTLVAKAYRWCADHDAQAGRQAARMAAIVAGFGGGACVGALCTRFIGPRAVWAAAPMLVLALAAIVIETVTLSSIETTDDHWKQDDSPRRTPQLSHPARRSGARLRGTATAAIRSDDSGRRRAS
jgi:uncharacterized membrane protein YoaK (UPF0700 family)